ncbi:uncharacterized protein TNIN_278861 [Trichonephila inaurata madagascariensis]|uniref:EFHB C-terminal EF-hand domain-containing protein n=1 Tax=Trichonephila inaurata madagascariensis TaxID=2747483 RepID=A0A8X7CE49_9ARAC|nr:uncharacterized protein TNIN_278861 [Trichonephila inaurata madagascariensis]
MKKQHFTTEVSSLVNPQLPTKYEQLQQESLEKIYASTKRYPLGRTHAPNIPWKAMNKRFGISTEMGDSADILMHPLKGREFCSMYTYDFHPPIRSNHIEISSAPVKSGIDYSGGRVKELLNETGNVESTVIIPLSNLQKRNIKKEMGDKYEPYFHFIIPKNDACCLTTYNLSKASTDANNLLIALWNLVKNKKTCYRKNFTSFLKSYLQNFSKTFTLSDLQKMFENFDVCISKHTLKQVLCTFGVLDNEEDINYDKFLKALKWEHLEFIEACNKKASKGLNDRNISKQLWDNSVGLFKTSASVIGDHKSIVPSRIAGIPSLRNDIRKPKLKSVEDFNEYGDIKNAASVIQPSTFEKYGIYEEDLGALRSKEEIITILFKSGISFNNETFDMVWDTINEQGKASIGEIWNALKHLCLSKNNLFIQ